MKSVDSFPPLGLFLSSSSHSVFKEMLTHTAAMVSFDASLCLQTVNYM